MDLARFTDAASRLLARLRNSFRETAPLSPKQKAAALGREGERIAERFLKKAGYKILYRNFRPFRGGEVDLVCRVRRAPELIFVEVKTRSAETFGAPHQAVDGEKQRGLVQAAQEWLEMLDRSDVIARFDIVEVLPHPDHWEVRHLPNAFLAEETLHPGSLPVNPGARRAGGRREDARVNAGQFRRRGRRC